MSRFESVDSFATPPHSRKRSRSLPAYLRLSAADSEHEQPDGDIVMSEPKSTHRHCEAPSFTSVHLVPSSAL